MTQLGKNSFGRTIFEQRAQRLQNQVLILSSMVSDAVLEAISILKQRNMPRAQQLIDLDRYVNDKRHQITVDCLALIATQNPRASDLRIITSMLEITTELERMHDYAKGIAKITLMMGRTPQMTPPNSLEQMALKAHDMLRQSMTAFVQRDAELARATAVRDDEVDHLYKRVYQEIIEYITANPDACDHASQLLWVAHNLERTADRVTNICEQVIFIVTGKLIEFGTSSPE